MARIGLDWMRGDRDTAGDARLPARRARIARRDLSRRRGLLARHSLARAVWLRGWLQVQDWSAPRGPPAAYGWQGGGVDARWAPRTGDVGWAVVQ